MRGSPTLSLGRKSRNLPGLAARPTVIYRGYRFHSLFQPTFSILFSPLFPSLLHGFLFSSFPRFYSSFARANNVLYDGGGKEALSGANWRTFLVYRVHFRCSPFMVVSLVIQTALVSVRGKVCPDVACSCEIIRGIEGFPFFFKRWLKDTLNRALQLGGFP